MIWPTANIHANSAIPSWAKFGARAGKHTGIDIGHRYGSAVVAADDGTVRFTGDMKAGGYAVWITHANGIETRYLHLQPTSILVKRGELVAESQPIAKVGHSGLEYAYDNSKLVSASHLHFEVLKDGKYVDPEAYLGASGIALATLLTGVALVVVSLYGG